jgi:hypothetical protein
MPVILLFLRRVLDPWTGDPCWKAFHPSQNEGTAAPMRFGWRAGTYPLPGVPQTALYPDYGRRNAPATPLPSFPNSGGAAGAMGTSTGSLSGSRHWPEMARGRASPTVCRATYGGRGGTQTAARPGSKAGPSHPRRRRAGPAARRTWTAASPPASRGRVRRVHRDRCRAAGGICARAASAKDQRHSHVGGGMKAYVAGQPNDPQTGAKALFWM